jgi:hypothetical protein
MRDVTTTFMDMAGVKALARAEAATKNFGETEDKEAVISCLMTAFCNIILPAVCT